ncbi:hypothetical protein Nepgr_007672 [Nepenthes gracilis]|uniref:Uncharacterized protein n=1 Tax=Nepenthes gracilis TaxID=150966 RepID=A0AAD3XIH1_NEPGR|nr:hypothetical protein Nepgr_007672 [Nepenthes gracilis]
MWVRNRRAMDIMETVTAQGRFSLRVRRRTPPTIRRQSVSIREHGEACEFSLQMDVGCADLCSLQWRVPALTAGSDVGLNPPSPAP